MDVQFNPSAFWKAKPGSVFVYHIGFLPIDTMATLNAHALEIWTTAAAARSLYEQGLAELTQRKLAPGIYEYRLTKRRQKRKIQ